MADTLLEQLAKTNRNPIQETQYQQLLSQNGGQPSSSASSTSGVPGGSDYASTVQQQLKLQQDANAPAIASLQASIPEVQKGYSNQLSTLQGQQQPLEQRYQSLLGQIKANQAIDEQRTSTAASAELGRRGISSQSGFYDQYVNKQLTPVTQGYTSQYAQTGADENAAIAQLQAQIAQNPIQQTAEERQIQNAIAQLQSGGASSAIGQALSQYQAVQAQTNAQKVASIQANPNYVAIPGYGALNALTGGIVNALNGSGGNSSNNGITVIGGVPYVNTTPGQQAYNQFNNLTKTA